MPPFRVVFGGAGALSTIPADGSGAATSLLASDPPSYNPTSISPDGKTLIGNTGRQGAVVALPLGRRYRNQT
jgi:hypothetical protein